MKSNFISLFLLFAILSAQDDSGKSLYNEYCSACHGLNGDGKGEFSYLLYPKPRDLSKGQFKLRSTEQGQPPLAGIIIIPFILSGLFIYVTKKQK